MITRNPDHTVLRTFYLQVRGPEHDPAEIEVAEALGPALSEAEENIADLLPEGYSVKIGEWDHE